MIKIKNGFIFNGIDSWFNLKEVNSISLEKELVSTGVEFNKIYGIYLNFYDGTTYNLRHGEKEEMEEILKGIFL